jgi:hypothetical protein
MGTGFIVESVSKRPGEPPFRVTKTTRKDALFVFDTVGANYAAWNGEMIYDAFISALTDAGVREPANRVVISRIPVRT